MKYVFTDPNSDTEKKQDDVDIRVNNNDLLNTSAENINQNDEQASGKKEYYLVK